LFALPGTNANYWTFLPGVLLLGIGMAISVAPLTTTVMTSVDEQQAGIASGINNAVARTAGLLAVAVLGVVMLQVFSGKLQQRLSAIQLPDSTRSAIYSQRFKLGGIQVSAETGTSEKNASQTTANDEAHNAIRSSFVSAFRIVMFISAALAMAGALISWLMIAKR
jgi:hypothetical protein